MKDHRTYASSSEGSYYFNVQTGVCTNSRGRTKPLRYEDRYIVAFDIDLYKEMFGHDLEVFNDSIDICDISWHTLTGGALAYEKVDRVTLLDRLYHIRSSSNNNQPWVLHLEQWLKDNLEHPKVQN